ncbi:MAG: hypothetical protein IPK67_02000 [Planctomycetes bacterium]|jgi:hypothetical protein|nr:hypothetical protein [Planctomycetota bacterium]
MQPRDPYAPPTLIAGAVVLVAASALVLLLVPALQARRVEELKAQRGWTSTPAETTQTKASQAARIASYAWIDREKGVVAIPIERAMELVAGEAAAPAEGERK